MVKKGASTLIQDKYLDGLYQNVKELEAELKTGEELANENLIINPQQVAGENEEEQQDPEEDDEDYIIPIDYEGLI